MDGYVQSKLQEILNIIYIFFVVLMLVCFYCYILVVLGVTCTEIFKGNIYLLKRGYNKCCSCFIKPINKSVVAPVLPDVYESRDVNSQDNITHQEKCVADVKDVNISV